MVRPGNHKQSPKIRTTSHIQLLLTPHAGRQATHLGSRRAQDPQVHGRRRRRHRADSQAPEQTCQHHDHRAVPPARRSLLRRVPGRLDRRGRVAGAGGCEGVEGGDGVFWQGVLLTFSSFIQVFLFVIMREMPANVMITGERHQPYSEQPAWHDQR